MFPFLLPSLFLSFFFTILLPSLPGFQTTLHSFVCAWSKQYDPELQQTLDLWKSLLLTGSRRGLGERLWHRLLTQATGSPHPGRKHPCLFFLQATKPLPFLGDRPEGQNGPTAVTETFLSSRGNPSLTHSFISKELRSWVLTWSSYHPLEQPENRLSGDNFIYAKTAQGMAYYGAGSCAPFSHRQIGETSKM